MAVWKEHMMAGRSGTELSKELIEKDAHKLWQSGYDWYSLPYDRYGRAHFQSCADLFAAAAVLYHLTGNNEQQELCEDWHDRCRKRFHEDV